MCASLGLAGESSESGFGPFLTRPGLKYPRVGLFPLFVIANSSTFGTLHMQRVLTPGYEAESVPAWPPSGTSIPLSDRGKTSRLGGSLEKYATHRFSSMVEIFR